MKVLVVEDEPRSRAFYLEALESEGYEVDGAQDGETALKLLAAGGYEFVLLDILMDGVDGIETCRRIRSELGLINLPICMITASMEMEKVVASFEYGANGYIVKPF